MDIVETKAARALRALVRVTLACACALAAHAHAATAQEPSVLTVPRLAQFETLDPQRGFGQTEDQVLRIQRLELREARHGQHRRLLRTGRVRRERAGARERHAREGAQRSGGRCHHDIHRTQRPFFLDAMSTLMNCISVVKMLRL